jgi:ubiquinone biosynthesis protein UbiJ
MMQNFFLTSFSKIINTYLNLDPLSKQRLKKIVGHYITIEFFFTKNSRSLPFNQYIFQMYVSSSDIQLLPNEEYSASAKISGTPLQLITMAINKKNRNRFFADDLKIAGDPEVAREIIRLFDEIEIDWETQLARLMGDIPAYHVNRTFDQLSNWVKNSKDIFSENIKEYLQEEIKLFPSSESLQDFFNDIDNLRMHVDRLEARINLLSSQINKKEP